MLKAKFRGCRDLSASKNGYKYWYLKDNWHRENGPAVTHDDGNMLYYLYGEFIKMKRSS